MAPLSPRRSSRARPTHPQSHQSSGSSSNTGRSERNTRSVNKPTSGKSTPSASLSSEPLEDFDDTMMSRRRTRGGNDDIDRTPRVDDYAMASTNEDVQDEEDEAVRCICGSEDYPGLPPADNPDADFFASIELTEDLIGFFVQCDICKVWQHGACVGIFSAEASPDEYFCEQCRKDLHKIHTASNGQKYTKFLPLHRTASRNTSRATSLAKEGTRSPRSGSKNRPNSASQHGKRRSTMNSRDAAYDDEQLRRAIEASKEDGTGDSVDGSVRRPKRGRSDSEENGSHVKRQRTSSRSMSPPPVQAERAVKNDSDDESNGREKKQRNGRAQREKTEKEERERQRQEAANKRKGRAERRRADDSPPSEEIPAVVKSVKKSVEPSQPIETPEVQAPPVPDTPPPAPVQVPASSHKRGARSNHKGKGKGKNQYTKDRELDNDDSPARSMSRDIQKVVEEAAPSGTAKPPHTEAKHKAKAAAAHKVTMHEMRRRVGGIMDFISKIQIDLATEELPSSSSSSAADTPKKDGEEATKPFKDLSCMEMMDVLTRDMVKWQNSYV